MLKQATGGGCGVCFNPVFRKEIYSRIFDPTADPWGLLMD